MKSLNKQNNLSLRRRCGLVCPARGQAVIEAAVGLILFLSVFIGCLLLFLNTVVVSDYQRKLSLAASEAAKVLDAQEIFLGMRRPSNQLDSAYNRGIAEANARQVADSILSGLGLPKTTSFTVEYPSETIDWQRPGSAGGNNIVHLTRVTCTVNGLRTIGRLFVPFVSISGHGISTSGEVPPYAFMTLNSYGGGSPAGKQAVIGCYGVADSRGKSKNLIPPGKIITPTKWAYLEVRTPYPYSPDTVIKDYVRGGSDPHTVWW